MKGYYELKSTVSGKPMFNLRAGNHEIILTSETYETKQAALDGIASVRVNGMKSEAFERKVAADGQMFFVLKAANGQIIGKSELYTTDAARDHGIVSVKRNCAAEKIVEKETKAAA